MESRYRPITSKPLEDWMECYFNLTEQPVIEGNPSPLLNAARFALCGLDKEEDQIIAIQTTDSKIGVQGTKPYIRRDYDSIIGYSTHFPVQRDVAFFPLPNDKRTLTKRVHVKSEFLVRDPQTERLQTKLLDPSKIPNVIFATFGERGSVRIHFPGLFSSARDSVTLTRNEKRMLYDSIIRPAAQHSIPEAVHDWPASFSSAEFKDRNQKEGFTNSSILIASHRSRLLSEQMRQVIDREPNLSWAKDFVWGVEVRGIKDTCFHELDDPEFMISEAYESAVEDLAVERGGMWWIDVGLEYLVQNDALLWSSDQHVLLLKETLGITQQEANSIICGRGSSFVRDPATHIRSLSGFRGMTGEYGGDFEVAYIQAYTTDKSQTYHPSGLNFGKAITPMEAMHGTPPTFCNNLQETYHDARSLVDVATRLEVRVPIKFAQKILINPPDSFWQGMVSYPRDVWWSYRQIKLIAATNILTELNMMARIDRAKEANLIFILGLVYIINSLHSRPDDSSLGRQVARAVLPCTSDGTTADSLEADLSMRNAERTHTGMTYAPGGVIFLRPFWLLPEASEIRFEYQSYLTEGAFFKAWNCLPNEARSKLFNTTGFGGRNSNKSAYIAVRKGNTRKHRATNAQIVVPSQFTQFSDIPVPQEKTAEQQFLDLPPAPEDTIDLAKKLAQIAQQYATDIIQKLPKPHAKYHNDAVVDSYCPLPQDDRLVLTFEDIRNNNDFTRLFNCLQYRIATKDEYVQAFNYLFPAKGARSSNGIRHYYMCTYWMNWKELMDELDAVEALTARQQMARLILSLPWLPAASHDRIWTTNQGGAAWVFIPSHVQATKKTAPQILIYNKYEDVPHIRDVEEEKRQAFLHTLRQEEEEGSE